MENNTQKNSAAYAMACLALCLLLAASASFAEPVATESTRRFADPVFDGHLYVDEYGRFNSRKMLLIHGIGDIAANDWKKLAPLLSDQYHLIVPDLPGFGRSSKGNKLYSLENYAEVLAWLIKQYGADRITVVGHSMGGAIALHLAANHPQLLDKLIIIDAAGILHRTLVTEHVTRISDEGLLRKIFKPAIKGFNAITRGVLAALEMEETPEELQRILNKPDLRQQYLDGEPSRIAGVSMVAADFSRVLPAIKTPGLVIWGSDDPVSPVRTAYMLTRNLPHARLEIIPFADHGPINTQPKKTAKAILGYLQTPASTRRGALPSTTANDTSPADRNCKSSRGVSYRGYYNNIKIRSCKKVLIENATIQSLKITGGQVTIRNSIITGGRIGIDLKNSHLHIENSDITGLDTGIVTVGSYLTVSGAVIKGDIAILNRKSRLDLAGVSLQGTRSALENKRGHANVMFSASRSKSGNGLHFLHGHRKVFRQQPL